MFGCCPWLATVYNIYSVATTAPFLATMILVANSPFALPSDTNQAIFLHDTEQEEDITFRASLLYLLYSAFNNVICSNQNLEEWVDADLADLSRLKTNILYGKDSPKHMVSLGLCSLVVPLCVITGSTVLQLQTSWAMFGLTRCSSPSFTADVGAKSHRRGRLGHIRGGLRQDRASADRRRAP